MSSSKSYPNIHHLWVLNTLFEELHISRTAERLDISQSAVSKAVANLREYYEDPLLIRGKGGYQISHKGRVIRQRLPQILTQLNELHRDLSQDPTKLDREFRICMADDAVLILPPDILRHFNKVAPGIRLTITGDAPKAFKYLQSGKVDMVIDVPIERDTGFLSTVLCRWDWLCVMNRSLMPDSGLDLEAYLKANHGLVSFDGDNKGVVDVTLAYSNQQRRVSLVVPYFSAIPEVLRESNLIFTVPAPLIKRFQQDYLAVSPPPIDLPPLSISSIWHSRHQYDSVHRWIREQIHLAISKTG